jgi:hypothetical protein
LFGGGGFEPISSEEMTYWQGLWKIRNWEYEQAMKKRR